MDQAAAVFERLEAARAAGKVRAFGWSTDFPASAAAMADRPGFVAVQHAMNLFFAAASMLRVVEAHKLVSINRSPLAMGLLTGKFAANAPAPPNDVRQNSNDWLGYFKGGRAVPSYVTQLDAVRDLLRTDGRTLAQEALAWLWAKSDRTLPIPGFRGVAQVQENAGALDKGPLPDDVMRAIEAAIEREPEGAPRER